MGLFSSRPSPPAAPVFTYDPAERWSPPAYTSPASASSSSYAASSSSPSYSQPRSSRVLAADRASERASSKVLRQMEAEREEARIAARRSQALRKQQIQQQQQQQQQNQRSVAASRRALVESLSVDPPIHLTDADGEWVLTEEFQGHKSFGFFKCNCGRSWGSAHVYKEDGQAFWQKCKPCDKKIRPIMMWRNYHTDKNRVRSAPDTDNRPHDRERCQKCIELGHACWKSSVY